jgi:protein tyrosine phosphatase (PTP) superfamily phosphohydrolase (DUF442 family)
MAHDPDDITGWQRLDAGITTSGRLTPPDLPRLAAIGVRHVINLALADSPGALADEAALLAGHGIGYSHIPVPFDGPQESHFAAFCAALETGPAPIHVHCIMNWRVSAFFYRYNRWSRGMAEDAARALMEQQWSPETNSNPHAPVWARFIAAGEIIRP